MFGLDDGDIGFAIFNRSFFFPWRSPSLREKDLTLGTVTVNWKSFQCDEGQTDRQPLTFTVNPVSRASAVPEETSLVADTKKHENNERHAMQSFFIPPHRDEEGRSIDD